MNNLQTLQNTKRDNAAIINMPADAVKLLRPVREDFPIIAAGIEALCGRPQCFTSFTLEQSFDIRAGWRAVASRGADFEITFLDSEVLAKADVDANYCASLRREDLLVPLLALEVRLADGQSVLHILDGWHRSIRLRNDGYNAALVMVLTPDEGEAIRFKSVQEMRAYQEDAVRENSAVLDPEVKRAAEACGCSFAVMKDAVLALIHHGRAMCEFILRREGVSLIKFEEFVRKEMGGAPV